MATIEVGLLAHDVRERRTARGDRAPSLR